METLNSFNNRFITIRSNSKSSLTTKKNEVMRLQRDLQEHYIFSYEYKMLENLIQKYSDELNNNPKSRSNRNKSLAESPSRRPGFGNVILDLNENMKRNKIGNIQNFFKETIESHTIGKIHNTVQINIKDYLYKETEYQYDYTPFIGSLYSSLICNRYLCNKHQLLTCTDKEKKKQARVIKPLEIFYQEMDGRVEYIKGKLEIGDIPFNVMLLKHLRSMDNTFTMFSGCTHNHAIAIFLQKFNNALYIYGVDSNSSPLEGVIELIQALQLYLQQKIGIPCHAQYITSDQLNFGSGDEFEQQGYCLLISFLFMEIIYDNMIIYKNISYDSHPDKILNYIKTMLNYLEHVFFKKNIWHTFLRNYAHKIFGEMGFFHEDENKTVPDYFVVASLRDIYNFNPFELKQAEKNFQDQFNIFLSLNKLFSRIVGINWTSRDYKDVNKIQKNNNFEYFIPENITTRIFYYFFRFKSLGKKDFFFNFENNFKSVTTEDHKNMFTDYTSVMKDILFLFIDMGKYNSTLDLDYLNIAFIYDDANFSALIEEINTQLDLFKLPFIEKYQEYINSKNLYKIALIQKKRKIKLTHLMSAILNGILDKNQDHLTFWDYARFSSPRNFKKDLVEFVERDLHLTYKYTMVNLGNNTINGYWVHPDECTKGIDPRDVDLFVNDQANSTIPREIFDTMMKILKRRNYTGNNNISSIVPFIKQLGAPTSNILYKIPMLYTFPSTKYNDRVFD